jgi:hypothetical protein
VDLSGFINTIKHAILKILNKPQQEFSLKPFDCSYCMTHHIGLIYLIIIGNLNMMTYATLITLAYLTPVIKDLMILVKDSMITFVDYLYRKTIS